MATSPRAALCAAKQHLTDALLQACHALTELLDREVASLMRGGMGPDRFDIAMTRARQRRHDARWALVSHSLEHGC